MRSSFDNTIQRRILIVLLFFLVGTGLLLARLFVLQIVNHQEYNKLAASQHRLSEDLLPRRGSIFSQDKNGSLIPLALNKVQKNLIASPRNIEDPKSAAAILFEELGLKEEELLPKLSKSQDAYEVIAKKLDAEQAEKLQTKLPKGFFFEEEQRRVYPHDDMASKLIGFVSIAVEEEIGRYGIERNYNQYLSGERGFLHGAKDASGFLVAIGRRIIDPPKNGSDVVLTVDYNIQAKAEEVLQSVVKKWSPQSGALLVLDPKTGKILAEAAYPSYNINEFSKVKDYSIFLNPIVESTYELGSVLKPITMAAGISEGVVGPSTTYFDTGEVKIGGYTIKNFDLKSHQTQTMTQVIENSLNTGMVHVARLLGKQKQLEYFKRFGLGEKTGIDLPGEVAGNISNLKEGRDIDYATASFGQGIAVTPIQLISAIASIANDGKMMKPYVVERIKDDSGNEIKYEPVVKGEVLTPENAEKITKMLISTVKSGFENRAGVKGYFVAGKTGTAQVPRTDGRGYSDKVIHTFVGFAPAFEPKFLIYLQINEPTGNRFAANTLTPAFHDLAQYILNYYEVPPDEK